MATERFTKKVFEDELPVHKTSGEKLWEYIGVDKGESVYIMKVRKVGVKDIVITIRSSVRVDGVAAATGEDSIRAWLSYEDGKPVGSKLQNYVQRLPGWEKRLTQMLRGLYQRALKIEACGDCGEPKGIFKVKKEGSNKGKLFTTCYGCGYKKHFAWVK
jgi:hypothetical protein